MLGDISGVENIYIVCGYTDMKGNRRPLRSSGKCCET